MSDHTVIIKCNICNEMIHVATTPADVNRMCREHVEQRHKVRAAELAALDEKVRKAAARYKDLQLKFMKVMDMTFKFDQGLYTPDAGTGPTKIGNA